MNFTKVLLSAVLAGSLVFVSQAVGAQSITSSGISKTSTIAVSLKVGDTYQLPYKTGYKYSVIGDIDEKATVTISSKGLVKANSKGKNLVIIQDSSGSPLNNYDITVK